MITFRNLTLSDIDVCLAIMKENYPNEQYDYWRDFLIRDIWDMFNQIYPSGFSVIISDEVIVGFGGYLKIENQDNIYKLTWINVSPKEQGKGIGKQLIVELEKKIKEYCGDKFRTTLETDKPNFYKKLGYTTFDKNGFNDVMIKIFI